MVGGHGKSPSKQCGLPAYCGGCTGGRRGGSRELALTGGTGRSWSDAGRGRSLGAGVPYGDQGGGRRAAVVERDPGGGHRRCLGGARVAARLGVVGRRPAQGRTRCRRNRRDWDRHRRRLRHQRDCEIGCGRRSALSRGGRSGDGSGGVSRSGGLVVPEQPRHPGRRARGRAGRPASPARGDGSATGCGGGGASSPGRCPLPARRARRSDPRGLDGGGGRARAHPAGCPAGVTAAGVGARGRCPPRGPSRPPQPGCPRTDGPGWS